ncbi:MAG: ATP synthase subunit I [Methylovulum sp.]|nr:ATP synthase subunit I [Methylovulum sp.]
MNEILVWMLAWLAGMGLGAVFFGGLWWTVRKGLSSRRPWLWIAFSSLLRTGIALVGFYVVAGDHWQRLLLCLLGFLMARLAVTWLTRLPVENQTQPTQESSHAP